MKKRGSCKALQSSSYIALHFTPGTGGSSYSWLQKQLTVQSPHDCRANHHQWGPILFFSSTAKKTHTHIGFLSIGLEVPLKRIKSCFGGEAAIESPTEIHRRNLGQKIGTQSISASPSFSRVRHIRCITIYIHHQIIWVLNLLSCDVVQDVCSTDPTQETPS